MFKMPVFTWASPCANILIIASFPILTVTVALLTLDRYLGTHFFTNDMGGNMMMYINLIRAWVAPESVHSGTACPWRVLRRGGDLLA
ncbi:hypothetical protein ACNKHO_02395 [Shigella flexneri]